MVMFYEKLLEVSGSSHVKTEEKMSGHTTFRTGGPASYYVSPSGMRELADILRLCRSGGVPYFILGNGSNLLVGDGGFEGVVISMTEGYSGCQVMEKSGEIVARAGELLSRVARVALKAGLTGFEFAAGIPGTAGGAAVMNAGAYGSEMKDVIKSVQIMTPEGEMRELSLEELKLGYRTSSLVDGQYVVLEVRYQLKAGDTAEIKAYMEELAVKRKHRQPLEFPSAGSTFKRPDGNFAGKLIEEAGLLGYRVGGAAVSQKHCGFIINKDRATSSDIMGLCKEVKKRVHEYSGVELELEMKTLGVFGTHKGDTE